MSQLYELSLICPEAKIEDIANALEELEAQSVSVEDADAMTDAEQALFGEPGMPPPKAGWLQSLVKALFLNETLAQTASAELKGSAHFKNHLRAISITEVANQDWVRLTQSQFEPVAITHDFWIVPSWHDIPKGAKTAIELDPGLAFGTGTHPTTRMCLEWIATEMGTQNASRVLDYGCGSGILAIAAAKFGIQHIDAVDIDEAALEASNYNASKNKVEICTGLPEMAQGEYDVVLANILATPLKVLAPLLSAHVKVSGLLVLAGILARQEAELKAAYASFVELETINELDGWVLMRAIRKA